MIERRAVGDDADRRAQGVVQVGAFDGDHGVAARQRQPGKIAEEVRQPRQLRAGLVDGTAVVQRLQPVQRIEIGLEGVREAIDQPRAGTDVHAAPRLAFEGCARAFHGAVDVGSRSNSESARSRRRWRDCGRRASRRSRPRPRGRRRNCRGFRRRWCRVLRNVHASLPSTMTALRLSAGSTRFSVCAICALMMRAAVRPSRRCIASISATCSATSLCRVVAFQIGDADAHQPIGLSDQVAQRRRHAAVAGGMRQRGVEGAVIGDEVFMVAGEAAEFIERLQDVVARVLDRLRHAGRLQREAKPQQVARIRQRNRIDPVALARLHGDEMLALEPQQRLAHRLAAHGIALGEILFAHIIAGRKWHVRISDRRLS